nr:Hypothetical protein CBG04150 [Haemonchus contortus]
MAAAKADSKAKNSKESAQSQTNSNQNFNVCLMPTKEAIEATPGTPLTKEELARLQSEGQLPKNLDAIERSATMHNLKVGDQDFVVIMMDPPPCGCVRLMNGKKKRCKKHRQERRARRKAKKEKQKKEGKEGKMVKDDDSDRKKVVELRHAADSECDEDKAIDGAITPDKVAVVGPAGVAVLIDIEKVQGEEVGPRKKVDKPMKGILVKGAHETPQFIPEDKIEKGKDGQPKFKNYTRGTLVGGPHGESIFYADKQCQPDSKGNPQNVTVTGVDKNLQKKIGETVFPPCEVEVNEKGMPVLILITDSKTVPKDKCATVGVLVKNNEGVVVLAQSGGQTVGAKDNAECVPTTPTDKVVPGCVIGKVVEDKATGTYIVIHCSQAVGPNQKVVGTLLQGNYCEPIFVKDEAAASGNVKDTLPAIAKSENQDKQYQPQIEKANILVQAQVEGKTVTQIQKERAEMQACQPLTIGEVYSTALGDGARDTRSHFLRKDMEAPTGAGGPSAAPTGAGGPSAAPTGAGGPSAYKYQGKGVSSTFVNVDTTTGDQDHDGEDCTAMAGMPGDYPTNHLLQMMASQHKPLVDLLQKMTTPTVAPQEAVFDRISTRIEKFPYFADQTSASIHGSIGTRASSWSTIEGWTKQG